MGIPEGEERKEKKAIFEAIMTKNFPQIYVRHQTTDAGTLESTYLDGRMGGDGWMEQARYIIFIIQKSRIKKNSSKKSEGKTPYLQRSKDNNYI